MAFPEEVSCDILWKISPANMLSRGILEFGSAGLFIHVLKTIVSQPLAIHRKRTGTLYSHAGVGIIIQAGIAAVDNN